MGKSLNLAELLADRRTVDVDVFGEHVNVTYAPRRFTLRYERDYIEAERKSPVALWPRLLEHLVLEWDIDVDGKPLDVSVDAMEQGAPGVVWEKIGFALLADIRSGKALSRPTPAGSSPEASSATPSPTTSSD